MANFTGEGNYTSKLNQALTAPPASKAEFGLAWNIFLSITTAVGNALILMLPLRMSVLFILRQNYSFDVWRSLIFALVFLSNHPLLPT